MKFPCYHCDFWDSPGRPTLKLSRGLFHRAESGGRSPSAIPPQNLTVSSVEFIGVLNLKDSGPFETLLHRQWRREEKQLSVFRTHLLKTQSSRVSTVMREILMDKTHFSPRYVVRISTEGGVPPNELPKTERETARVKYRAIYLFLQKAG